MLVAPSFPSPGDSIGRFRVLAQLGAGGMGVVYDALEVNLERRVALKVISPMFADDPDFRSRFISEARALASLDSPNVVQVYAHGEEDGYLYIATQLVPDGDLGQMLTKWGPAPIGKAVELIEQVASGLADAHAAGLVHRDIKPANVLVRRRGAATVQAYLGDFGIARRVDAEMTRLGGAVIGTPSYMAPELHGGAQAGVTTDIYSLGCLLWVALTGKPPYGGTSEFEIVGGHISKAVPQLSGGSSLVEAVNRILRVAMAKEPGHRYRTALALRDDLREAARMTYDPTYLQLASAVSETWPPRADGRTPTPTPTPSGPVAPPRPATPARAQPAKPPPARIQPFTAPTAPSAPRSQAPAPRRTALWVAIAAAAVAVVIGGVAALVFASGDGGGGGGGATDTPTTTPDPGFADGTAQEIITEAEKDMKVLDSVRLAGDIDQDGQPGGIDLVVTAAGNCDGELRVGDGSAMLRRIDGAAWLRPDRAFLEASADSSEDVDAYLALIGDKWVKADKTQAADFDDVCDLDEILEGDGSNPVVTKEGVEKLEGKDVVKVVQDAGTADEITAYVAVDSPHYVLKLESSAENGSFMFSDFDAPFDVQPPPDDEVIDLEGLGG